MRSIRPVCLACVSVDVEAIVDAEPADAALFACFDCQDVFYFMADTRPRIKRLGLFETYEGHGASWRGSTPTGRT